MTNQLSEKFLNSREFQAKLKNIIDEGDMNVLTAFDIRQMLETYFGFEKDALSAKPYKKIVNSLIDKFISSGSDILQNNSQPAESTKRKASVELEDEDDILPSKRKSMKKKAKIESDDEERKEEKSEEEGESEEENEDYSPVEVEPKKNASTKTKSTTSQPKKKASTKAELTIAPGSEKDEDTIKRLKQFISKCGVRKVWSKELADCKNTREEIAKLKNMLKDLGVHGRPSIEKCEAIKRERELKAELDSLDTSLIIDQANERPTRRSRNAVGKPNYTIDTVTDSEEEELDDDNNEAEEVEEGSGDENEDEETASESEDEFRDSSDEE
ncbi:hypothetical protein A0J61_07878 [Choanephora cucurbitarum]|uniref:DEK-C domain-containing protein n=1 Tax=Choanephora cucurbitarum TaxID=101091 RepID=A0A1C7N4X8_9FUNG|nr:hypothetical protein A0J61_07878 [Choanephora cucurbitarum]